MAMRIAIGVGSAYYDGSNWEEIVDLVVAADKLGVDVAWSAEAWGMETIAPLAYLAALTERIQLGTGIMQISARTPSMTAMTALAMARITNDRFLLGLGVSGPQVVEGLHGVRFAKPLSRLKEYVEIVQLGLRGERLSFEGEHYVLPRPGGEGKALRLSMPPKPDLPIYLATLGPKSLEFTGAVAAGWLGTSFVPEAAEISFAHLRAGAEAAGRQLSDLDLQVGGAFDIDDDLDAVIDRHRPRLAFTLGAMGSANTNFYNDAYSRAGWADTAAEVQSLWVEGKKDQAIAAVPDDFVLAASLIGDEQMVIDRVRAHADAGITTLRIGVSGKTLSQQLDHLERAVAIIRSASK